MQPAGLQQNPLQLRVAASSRVQSVGVAPKKKKEKEIELIVSLVNSQLNYNWVESTVTTPLFFVILNKCGYSTLDPMYVY